jgi:hypothetical protein
VAVTWRRRAGNGDLLQWRDESTIDGIVLIKEEREQNGTNEQNAKQ